MNKTQGMIIVLLILAIVFSGVSIYISFSALSADLGSSSGISGEVVDRGNDAGGLNFYVEEKPPLIDIGSEEG